MLLSIMYLSNCISNGHVCEWHFLRKGEKEVNGIAIKLGVKNTVKLVFWITQIS